MNMFEEAEALHGMLNMCSMTQSELAAKMGVSQSYVANKLRLLNLSSKSRELILASRLTERHARALLRIKDEALLHTVIKKIRDMRLNVSESEALIDNAIVNELPRSIKELGARGSVERLEDIITEAIKNLALYGVKVRKSTDYYKNKRYITLCIEE